MNKAQQVMRDELLSRNRVLNHTVAPLVPKGDVSVLLTQEEITILLLSTWSLERFYPDLVEKLTAARGEE